MRLTFSFKNFKLRGGFNVSLDNAFFSVSDRISEPTLSDEVSFCLGKQKSKPQFHYFPRIIWYTSNKFSIINESITEYMIYLELPLRMSPIVLYFTAK